MDDSHGGVHVAQFGFGYWQCLTIKMESRMRFLNAVLVSSSLFLSGMTQAASPVPEPKAGPSLAAIEKSFVVMPGKFAELNLTMSKNSEVRVAFEATDEVEWNIHSHKDKKTLIHKNGLSKGSQEFFKAEADGVFSYLWKNNLKTPVTLKVTLHLDKGSSVHSWHGDAP